MTQHTLPDEHIVKETASIIAVDPGREKTGVALVAIKDSCLLRKAIVPTETVGKYCADLLGAYSAIERIVCGNGTNHQAVFKVLTEAAKEFGKEATLTDEKHTTEEARVRYFEWNPPKGLKRLIPKGMLYPPEPVDDFTAWVIGERYLNEKKLET
ncbi:MAG: hypothetical protein KHZ77_05500 [Veillonella sp.]|uniref:hypothetical protein n=1 Tax=Veillonella sp. TaxID=1926307 RepID=UPI0025F13F7D|nr:hypothetical protein [Veillonella sp.]MBS4913602.1 hypothetical protein [Veillonella sp.]